MYKFLCATAALAVLLLVSGIADAYGSLRCKGRIIDVGASAADVITLCGEPSRRIETQIPVRVGTETGFTRFAGFTLSEQWVYERGYGRFPAVLFFDEGRLFRIEYLPQRSGD